MHKDQCKKSELTAARVQEDSAAEGAAAERTELAKTVTGDAASAVENTGVERTGWTGVASCSYRRLTGDGGRTMARQAPCPAPDSIAPMITPRRGPTLRHRAHSA